jgi:inorganic pyrophosphatase
MSNSNGLNNLLKSIEHVDNSIDSSLEDIKDITDTVGDLIKPIKIMMSVYQYSKKRKFKAFIKAYALNVDRDNNKLDEYLEDEKNLNFLYESIDSAVNSKSVYCSRILGYYTSTIINKVLDINYKHLIVISALRDLNDFELQLFIKTYQIVNLGKPVRIRDYEGLKPYFYLCEKVVQKLKFLGLLDEVMAGSFDGTYGWGTFSNTEMAEELYDISNELDIDTELALY